jgi:hypothetical protein
MRWYHHLLLLHLQLRALMLSVRLLLRSRCLQLLQLAPHHHLLLQQHQPQSQDLHWMAQLQLQLQLLLDLPLHLPRQPLEAVSLPSCLSFSRAERASCVLDSAQLSAAAPGLLLAAVALLPVLMGQHRRSYLI